MGSSPSLVRHSIDAFASERTWFCRFPRAASILAALCALHQHLRSMLVLHTSLSPRTLSSPSRPLAFSVQFTRKSAHGVLFVLLLLVRRFCLYLLFSSASRGLVDVMSPFPAPRRCLRPIARCGIRKHETVSSSPAVHNCSWPTDTFLQAERAVCIGVHCRSSKC